MDFNSTSPPGSSGGTSTDCQVATATWVLMVSTVLSTAWAMTNEILARRNRNSPDEGPLCVGDCIRGKGKEKTPSDIEKASSKPTWRK